MLILPMFLYPITCTFPAWRTSSHDRQFIRQLTNSASILNAVFFPLLNLDCFIKWPGMYNGVHIFNEIVMSSSDDLAILSLMSVNRKLGYEIETLVFIVLCRITNFVLFTTV
jgi:hypothetical protein